MMSLFKQMILKYNDCLDRQQKLYEKHAFKNPDQSIVNK